jgi:hypothetical protein
MPFSEKFLPFCLVFNGGHRYSFLLRESRLSTSAALLEVDLFPPLFPHWQNSFRFQFSCDKSTWMMHKSSLYLSCILCFQLNIKKRRRRKMARIGRAIAEFFTLTEEQRHLVGEKVLELGNIGASALVFGTALAEGRIKWQYMLAGALFWLLMFCGYLLITRSRGGKND